jgi:Zn-dependent M28 family amino/carboxypeptidase
MTVVVTAALGGCGDKAAKQANPPSTPVASGAATDYATKLSKQVSTDAMMGHLAKLQDIANANNGNRALGTSGYEASADYVAKALRDKGFDVQSPTIRSSPSAARRSRPSRCSTPSAHHRRAYPGRWLPPVSRTLPAAPRPITTGCRCKGPSYWSTVANASSR